MLPINLKSVVLAHNELSEDRLNELSKLWGVSIKPKEYDSLVFFAEKLESMIPNQPELLFRMTDKCYLGFTIPRISKEFDCLWIGNQTIVNVELKSGDVEKEKIRKQLIQNRYYLKHLQKQVKSYTLVSSTKECFSLDENECIVKISFRDVAHALHLIHSETLFDDDIETLFTPEQFLVSPFNSTEEFVNNNYFLTHQQQQFKNNIIQFINNANIGFFCALNGGPGSGKTLLAYDIAKEMMASGLSVVIGHSGSLNPGQEILNNRGWNVKSTKCIMRMSSNNLDIEDADFYVIDEAQRCYHLKEIANIIKNKGKKCLFSFDSNQILNDDEQKYGNGDKIMDLVGDNYFRLSSNIRMKSSVYEFVNALFDKRYSVNKVVRGDINITYCKNSSEALTILELLSQDGYSVPVFTPLLHSKADYESWFPQGGLSAHQVIGQEFDNIAGLLSEHMYYNNVGKLVSAKKYYYREDRMLYQILSRARRKIHLVIVNNPTLLDRCLNLIDK